MITAEYWLLEPDGTTRCLLCPNVCKLQLGRAGKCGVRTGKRNGLDLPFFGAISSIAIDPIEKKPLLHFLEGSKTFSVGFWHCTMHCPFCQNWEIAQPRQTFMRTLTPEALIGMALDSGCPSISFTYSEPTLHIEYVKACMNHAREAGLKTVLVTNGNLNAQPAADILALTDATNVDIKTASEEVYSNVLGGSLQIVKKFIQIASEKSHVEVTTLLVPGISDEASQIFEISSFLNSIDRRIPLHITPYFPAYQWDRPPLDSRRTREIADPAFKLLDAVYVTYPRYF